MTTAVVVASGELHPADARYLDAADLVVAADGGALSAERCGRLPDVLVGDLDSIDRGDLARLEAAGVAIERHSSDKDASDTELALERAVAMGAARVDLLGATGGQRLDHELANVLLVADPRYAALDVRLVHGSTVVRVVHGGGSVDLEARSGDVVALLPVAGDATGVTTRGLRWELDRATLALGRSRGLSNEVVGAPASVRLESGTLLVVVTQGGTPS